MNKATKSLLAGLALSLSIGVFTIKGSKENAVNPIIVDIANRRIEDSIVHDKYLQSFAGASFSFKKESISFNGSLPVGRLFEIKHAERPQVLDYAVNFNVTYLPKLELGRIKVSLFSTPNAEPLMSENVYAYPFRDERGNADIEFFMNGYSFKSSEFMSGREIKDDKAETIAKISAFSAVSQSIMLEAESETKYLVEKDDGDFVVNAHDKVKDYVYTTMTKTTPESSGVIYPIAAITTSLLSIGFSVGLANVLFPRPDFFVEGLAALVLYEFKMNLAFDNYDHNKNYVIPRYSVQEEQEGYINTQGWRNQNRINLEPGDNPSDFAWEKWEYGFFNLRHSGCSVFAVYNMLVDSSTADVDLATLVLLFELCNADLLFAGVGSLPVDSWVAKTIANMLLGAFKGVILALMACLSLIPGIGWLIFLLGGFFYIVTLLVQAYIDNQRDLGAVLDILGCSYSHGDFIIDYGYAFDGFVKDLESRRQGIVSYWHKLDSNGMPDITGNAHFVYIRNDVSLDKKFRVYNNYKEVDADDETSLISPSTINAAQANAKTIGYYVIK